MRHTAQCAKIAYCALRASGESGILLEQGSKQDLSVSFNGTVLRMVVNTGLLGDLERHLERFKKEGYDFAKSLGNICQIEASTASMMLLKDFCQN